MLTDIFAHRYSDRVIWTEAREADRVLLVQGFRMISEQLFPQHGAKLEGPNLAGWTAVQSRLSMELGLESLAPTAWNFIDSQGKHQYGNYTPDFICKTWMLAGSRPEQANDTYMKERISLVELAFRFRGQQVAAANAQHAMFSEQTRLNLKSSPPAMKHMLQISLNNGITANAGMNRVFADTCEELNERFKRARVPLNYHNGFVQIEADSVTEGLISRPFWILIADPKWKNVETDMMEAVDRRESEQRDPAFYAAKALESVLKIISAEKGWTRGTEKSASHFIDNLRSSKNGAFIAEWEAKALRLLFADVRNELGHGPGGEPMPELTLQQTDWVIQSAMAWAKSLISRM